MKFLLLFNLIILMSIFVWILNVQNSVSQTQEDLSTKIVSSRPEIISASFKCNQNKKIEVQYFDNKAELSLSDGRNFLLMTALSGSGVRYTNSDESVTFWNKGKTAFLQENNVVTFNNCEQTND